MSITAKGAASKAKPSWRAVLEVHPAAEMFPLMKEESPEELRALGEDIKKGLQSEIVLYKDHVLDGRNRLDAMELVGINFQIWRNPSSSRLTLLLDLKPISTEYSGDDPYGYVISANIHRRHLKPEKRRELIATPIKQTPDKSDRQIAEQTKASPTTVGKVRKEMEAAGEVSRLDTRTDKRGVQQQAHKDPAVMAAVDRAIARSEENQRRQPAADSVDMQPGGEFNKLIAAKAPGWTGAIVGTQGDVNAAEKRLRDDGALGHWLILAPRERLIVDHRVIQWLLLTAPALPVIAHIEWVFALCSAANKARCPVWVSELLTGKSRSQQAGMTWPRELPIPQEVPLTPLERIRELLPKLTTAGRGDLIRELLLDGAPEMLIEAAQPGDEAPRSAEAAAAPNPPATTNHCGRASDPDDIIGPMPECLRRPASPTNQTK
jgi:hypothetical protein